MRAPTAAIVVAFRPEPAQIGQLVGSLARECQAVFVMDNGGGYAALADMLESTPAVRVVDMGGNRGIGLALNRGFELALLAGSRYVITFDQDSAPPPGMPAQLADAMERLAAQGVRVAAAGPLIVDTRGAHPLQHPFMRRRSGWPRPIVCSSSSELVEADFLITSGCLISLDTYQAVGGFDTDLFIDFVDMEWCFRAQAAGYRSYGICSAVMPHELGMGNSASAFGMTVLDHSALRRYYFARNTLRVVRLPYFSMGWKVRLLLSLLGRLVLLPVVVRFRRGWFQHWRMLIRGVLDGVARVGGAYVER
jgi:rhamnosyltransferase